MRGIGTYCVGHQVDRCVADLVASETDPDVVAASREGVDDVGPDEAGAAGHDRAHAPHPTEGEVRDAGPP